MSRFKGISFLIHLPGWLLFLAFPLLFMSRQSADASAWLRLLSPYYWQFCLCYIFIFYVNAYFLFPRFFLQKKYVVYAGIGLLLLTGICFLQPFDQLLQYHTNRESRVTGPAGNPPGGLPPMPLPGINPQPGDPASSPDINPSRPPTDNNFSPPGSGPRPPRRDRPVNRQRNIDITSIFLFIIMMALSAAVATVQRWQTTEQRVTRAEADKANAELSFLKAQINPHFLFNTLNNIYSLAIAQHENTAASIMKLSNIMRYVTDEVTEDFVPLSSEVACIRDYIDLQRLRLSKNTPLDFTVSGNLENKSIAPLILMTFIENVFKYGISNHAPAPITITLGAEVETIRFFCQNRIFAHRQTERTGIGLSNTRKRLAQLYPDKHLLNITQENHLFTVELTLLT